MKRGGQPFFTAARGIKPVRWVPCVECDEEHPVYVIDGREVLSCWAVTQRTMSRALYGTDTPPSEPPRETDG
jgi:hypothetical protein